MSQSGWDTCVHTIIRSNAAKSIGRPPLYLQEHVPLSDYKREVTAPMLWAVLLTAAVEVTSIHATCPRLADLPSEEDICKTFLACLPEFAEPQIVKRPISGQAKQLR